MRRLISTILVISICMVTFISYATDDVTETNEGENSVEVEGLEKLQGQKEEIQEQVEQAQEDLEDVSSELSENLQQIAKMDESIESSQETLNELNDSIGEIENEIASLQSDIEITTQEYNEKKTLLNERLVEMYKAGDTEYLDVLLKSSSISDFISTYFLITQMIEYDTNLIEVVESKKNELEEKNNQLETKKTELETQKQTQLKTQKVIENTKTLKQNIVKKLSEEEQEIQSQIDDYNNQITKLEEEIKSLAKTASFGEDYVGGAMSWPIANHYKITSYYGMRTHPITGVYKLHTGIDISAATGTDFLAAAYGIVTKAEYNTAYGNMVIIDHGGGVQTLYAHGKSIEVEVGQVVNAGDVVLKVGSTGYSTGPHAHFEIRINGETVNPLDYVEIPNSTDEE